MTPFEWLHMTLGKSYDQDKAYGFQCWDYFDAFIKYFKLPVSTYCALTGYVCDLWRLKEQYGYGKYFDFITDPAQLHDGDWCIFDKGSKSHPYSHVCMYFAPDVELGQNQGSACVTEKKTTFSDIMGALRFKNWSEIVPGASDITINGHSYSLYRQKPNQKAVVLSAGINKLKTIKELDCNAKVMAKITGANYFQAKNNQSDPIGTTYGDQSSTVNDVWRMLPNQNSTLYFDLNTGMYGDCTGIRIDMNHDVFSPGCVFPSSGNYQYGTFIGIDCVNIISRYSFCIRFTDGTYCLGICNQDATPKQIASDFKQYQIESIAFLDGGDSAQMGRVKDGIFEYNRYTTRAVPSAVALISTEPYQAPGNVPTEDETQKDEEQNMNEQNTVNEPENALEMVPVENWTDPEPAPSEHIILQRIASLMSVKSIITIFLTVVFGMLVLKGEELPDKFVSIYTMCISFFFGYQFKKAESGDGK